MEPETENDLLQDENKSENKDVGTQIQEDKQTIEDNLTGKLVDDEQAQKMLEEENANGIQIRREQSIKKI